MDDFRQMLAQLRQSVVSAPFCSNCGEMRYGGSRAESTAQPEQHLTESSDEAVEELARSQLPRGREGSLCAGFLQVEENRRLKPLGSGRIPVPEHCLFG